MTHDELMPLVNLTDGWHLDASRITPDVPLWGPYATKAQAIEARGDYLRSQPFRKTPLLTEVNDDCRIP